MFDKKLATHLAELSKIEFTKSELDKITAEMDEIISLMNTVSDFEDTEISTLNNAVGLDKIREDLKKPSSPRKDVLQNASEKDKKSFSVPKVV